MSREECSPRQAASGMALLLEPLEPRVLLSGGTESVAPMTLVPAQVGHWQNLSGDRKSVV